MARFADDRVELRHGVPWDSFEAFLANKDERVTPRVCYLDGVLELVTPSRGHEKHTSWIGALVIEWALHRGIDLSPYGSWLLKDKLRKAGAEPDDCFIIGDDSAQPLDRPHLVIEVQWSRTGVNKLEVYRRLRVPEVWFWERGAIAVHTLKGQKWRRVSRSVALPDLDLAQLVSFVDRPTLTRAIRDYRAALAEHA
jgi:Uma2 family endonuclease